ncbi:MAG TPA: carbohydrate-binding family 9-like protein [Pyrinomonadaceae bacterium]|nr:carbohydrate-binding family 9-like protein [Pyrinomonadaceae bacterium]
MINARFVNRDLSANDFDDRVWQECQFVEINRLWSGEPASPARYAKARICWSNKALHVRFDCVQQEPLVVSDSPQTDRKTLGLWDRDVCEIFLAPDARNPSRYFEFEAAPSGEWVDLGITIGPTGRETDWDFASGFTIAAKLEQERLVVGMRIPWSEAISKPQAGDKWRVNVFRCAGPESPERYLAWRPTRTPEPNFHVPEAFGFLGFE